MIECGNFECRMKVGRKESFPFKIQNSSFKIPMIECGNFECRMKVGRKESFPFKIQIPPSKFQSTIPEKDCRFRGCDGLLGKMSLALGEKLLE